ncbi:MAG: YcaO-like family protein [Candidatus Desulfofervidaceae bacterium]|nr:YcaO-like family protein [Candidatus Desulfofervidaceae bacterium]
MQLKDTFKRYTLDQDKAVSPDITCLQVENRLKRVNLKILQRIERIDKGRLDIPVFFSFYGEDGQKITGKKTQMGKGATPEQAKASALMELVERYSYFSFKQNQKRFKVTTHEYIVNPIPLELIAKSVHDEENLNKASLFLKQIPFRWAKAYNLTRDEEMWVPFDWFVAINEFNGTAAGNTLEEAIIQGLCEVIERHVCAVIAQEQRVTPDIDPSSVQDEIAQMLLQKFTRAGIKVYLKDFTCDMGIPTVGVLAYDPATFPRSEIVFTAGTQTSPVKSLIRALTETAQLAGDFLETPGYVASGLPKPQTLKDVSYVVQQEKTVSIKDLPDISHENIRMEIERAVDALEARGYEVLILDLTHDSLDIPVVYVLVPGARFWQRAKGTSLPLFLSRVIIELYPPKQLLGALQSLATVFPEHYAVHFYQGMAYLNQRQFNAATTAFERALNFQPHPEDAAIILSYLGYSWKEIGEYEKAVECLQRSLEYCSENKEVYNLLGRCYYYLSKYEDALEAFHRAITLDPSSAIDYANIAVNLEKLGKKEEAVFFYEKALKLDSSLGFARVNLERLKEE